MQKNLNTKRIAAGIAMFAILFVMFVSSIYISQHADHECTGTDCPICAIMNQCANNIKSIGTVAIVVATAFCLYLSTQNRVQNIKSVDFICSLISQKVRMNN